MDINSWLSNGYQYIVIKWLSNGYQYMVNKSKNMFGFLFKHFTQLSMAILFMFVYLFTLITPKFINVLGVASHMFYIGKS